MKLLAFLILVACVMGLECFGDRVDREDQYDGYITIEDNSIPPEYSGGSVGLVNVIRCAASMDCSPGMQCVDGMCLKISGEGANDDGCGHGCWCCQKQGVNICFNCPSTFAGGCTNDHEDVCRTNGHLDTSTGCTHTPCQ